MLRLRHTLATRVASLALGGLLAGCATTVPYTGVGPYPGLERGKPIVLVDTLGNILALPWKLLFWNRKFNSYYISPETEQKLIEYLETTQDLPTLKDAKFRLNQYRPMDDIARLIKNRHVAWPYRLLLGLPLTLILEVALPGRVFGAWVSGDHYNPFTNTVHLYSDHPAIALHEAGHLNHTAHTKYKGTYATGYMFIPGVNLYEEWQATKEALRYFKQLPDHADELNAYKILYPAYGSYVGNYIFRPIGPLVGILVGHVAGRAKAHLRENYYKELELRRGNRQEQPATMETK